MKKRGSVLSQGELKLRLLLIENGAENPDRVCARYGHWIRGYSFDEIGRYFGADPAEIQADIALARELLGNRVVTDDHVRELILKQREAERLPKSAPLPSVDELLKAGIDPGKVLRKYREEMQRKIGI